MITESVRYTVDPYELRAMSEKPERRSDLLTVGEFVKKMQEMMAAEDDADFFLKESARPAAKPQDKVYVVPDRDGPCCHGYAAPPFLMAIMLGEYELAEEIRRCVSSARIGLSCNSLLEEFVLDEERSEYGLLRQVNLGAFLFNNPEVPEELAEELFKTDKSFFQSNPPFFRNNAVYFEDLIAMDLPGDPIPKSKKKQLGRFPGLKFASWKETQSKVITRFLSNKKRLLSELPDARDYYLRCVKADSRIFVRALSPKLMLELMKQDAGDTELVRIWIDKLRACTRQFLGEREVVEQIVTKGEYPSPNDVLKLILRARKLLSDSALEKNEADAAFILLCIIYIYGIEPKNGGVPSDDAIKYGSFVYRLVASEKLDRQAVWEILMKILFCVSDFGRLFSDDFYYESTGSSVTETEAYSYLKILNDILYGGSRKTKHTVSLDVEWYSMFLRISAHFPVPKQPPKLICNSFEDMFSEETAKAQMELLLRFSDGFNIDPNCRKRGWHKAVLQVLMDLNREDLLRQAYEKGLVTENDARLMKKTILEEGADSNLTPYLVFLTQNNRRKKGGN